MKTIIILLICGFSFISHSFPIPKDNKATFDIIRKNKVIGSASTIFEKENENIIVTTIVDIKVKLLFISAYTFYQKSVETWSKGEFIKFEGYTNFEDDREYFIEGKDEKNNFIATGMDGKLKLNKNILPSNYWNMAVLKEKEMFDIQKGILREIEVKYLGEEILNINENSIETEKYSLKANKNPKDLGPFPQYTLWYAKKNGELIKFKFKNWKDGKDIITQRNNWYE